MVKDEWNSTQVLTRDQLFNVGEMAWTEGEIAKHSVIKGDYDVILYDKDNNVLETSSIQVKDGCELSPIDFENGQWYDQFSPEHSGNL